MASFLMNVRVLWGRQESNPYAERGISACLKKPSVLKYISLQ